MAREVDVFVLSDDSSPSHPKSTLKYNIQSSSWENLHDVGGSSLPSYDSMDPSQKASFAMRRPEISFIIKMERSFVLDDFILPLPYAHCEQFLYASKDSNISLRQHSVTWTVKVKFSSDQYKLGEGWRNFVVDTRLAMGDVCLFEVVTVTHRRKVYKVIIYRA